MSLNCKMWKACPTVGAWPKSLNTKVTDRDDKRWWIGRAWPQITRPGFPPEISSNMSKPWEADDDFVMYLNSGDWGTHPLEPSMTTVPSAFRLELEIPLSLSPDWQVALFSMYYTHSFSNAVKHFGRQLLIWSLDGQWMRYCISRARKAVLVTKIFVTRVFDTPKMSATNLPARPCFILTRVIINSSNKGNFLLGPDFCFV